MSQLNVNALSQPDAAPLNGVSLSGQQIGAPAGLGNNHSVGRTIGRILGAIFSLGISEAVLAIIRAVRAESAPAVPHLPQNRQLSPWERMREANKDLAARLSGDALPTVERGKSKALTALGTFGTVNADAFQQRLEKAVRGSRAQVDDAALENLAEKTARALLMESIVKTAVREDPEGASLTPRQQTLVAEYIVHSQQALALAEAPNAEAAEGLVAILKDVAQEATHADAAMAAVKQELLSTGLESFRKATGLSEEQTASFSTRNLENEMNKMQIKLDSQFATLARPYARAGRDALHEGFRPTADLFFADRATAYNSIANLNMPDSLKTVCRNACLVSKERISADTFSKAALFGRTIANLGQWGSLLDPELTVDEKLELLGEIATQVLSLWVESFGEEQVTQMSPQEKDLITMVMYGVVRAAKPELSAALRANPAVGALQTELQERIGQTMRTDAEQLEMLKQRNVPLTMLLEPLE